MTIAEKASSEKKKLHINWYRDWISLIGYSAGLLWLAIIHAMVLKDIFFEGLGKTTYSRGLMVFLAVGGFIGEVLIIVALLRTPKCIGLSENGIHIKWSKRKIKLVRWNNIERVEVEPPLFNNTFLILRSTGKREGLGAMSNRCLGEIRKMREVFYPKKRYPPY